MASGCSNCPNRVYPRMEPPVLFKSDIAVVTGAPHLEEYSFKQRNKSREGDVLRQVFAKQGLPALGEMFCTNALLCIPPQGKQISKVAADTCMMRVIEELEDIHPRLIIAVGANALYALTGDPNLKISNVQGRTLKSPLLSWDCPIVPIFSPGMVLRSPNMYQTFYASIKQAADIYNSRPRVSVETPTFKVFTEEHEIRDVIEVMSNSDLLSADIETTGLSPRLSDVISLGIGCEEMGNEVAMFPDEVTPLLKPLFVAQKPKWLWHNGTQFDTNFYLYKGYDVPVDEDTMIGHYCLNENTGTHDLETLAVGLLGVEPWEHEVRRYLDAKEGYKNAPRQILYGYQAKDVHYMRLIHKIIMKQILADPNLVKLYYNLLLPAAKFLRYVSNNGMMLDLKVLAENRKRLEGDIDKVMEQILDESPAYWDPKQYQKDTGAKTAPAIFNPGSPKQLSWVIYDNLRLLRGGKKKSTDEDHLTPIKGRHPLVDQILELRGLNKQLSTYVNGLEEAMEPDGRVHSTYLIHGTVTGRLASRDPNVQNIPRAPHMRNMFRAPEGRILMDCDFKSAELRMLAHMSGDKFLSSVFKEGKDLHTEVSNALGIPRIRAKAVNFGIAYGRKAFSLSEELGVSFQEAQQMINDWFARAAEAAVYMKSCEQAVMKGEPLLTDLGRYRRFGLISTETYDSLINEAKNFRIQSQASDMTLIAGMRLQPLLPKYDAKITNLVHDSIDLELPDDPQVINEVAKLVTGMMRQVPYDVINSTVPFEADVKIGKNWGSMHDYEIV